MDNASAGNALSIQPTAVGSTSNPFGFGVSDVEKLYVRNYADYSYVQVPAAQLNTIVPLITQAGRSTPQQLYTPTEGGYFVVLRDGTKYSFTLLPYALRINDDAYTVSQETYNSLKNFANQTISTGQAKIQWLTYMTPSRIASIKYYSDNTGKEVTIPQENLLDAASMFANILVQPGTGNAYTEEKAFEKKEGNTMFELTFDSGIVYSILIEKNIIYIESSDMLYGCRYRLETTPSSIVRVYDGFAAQTV